MARISRGPVAVIAYNPLSPGRHWLLLLSKGDLKTAKKALKNWGYPEDQEMETKEAALNKVYGKRQGTQVNDLDLVTHIVSEGCIEFNIETTTHSQLVPS